MSIAGILASHAYQQDFHQLTQALSTNDLAGARTAFKSMGETSDPESPQAPQSNPIDADLHSLATALQSGDVKSAQAAISRIQAELASASGPEKGRGISLLG